MNKIINCLMLKTVDQRCFFTHKNNYPQLIEFARTCEAEISVVKTQNIKVLELSELAKSICNHNNQIDLPPYEVVEVKIPELSKIKIGKNKFTQARIISSYIKKSFLENKVVSLADLENKFTEFNLSKAALCNHIARIRQELNNSGYIIIKVKPGHYKANEYSKKTNPSVE